MMILKQEALVIDEFHILENKKLFQHFIQISRGPDVLTQHSSLVLFFCFVASGTFMVRDDDSDTNICATSKK